MPRITKKLQPRRKLKSSASVRRPIIHVISDSTANLPRHMLMALLTQFPPDAFEVRFHTFVVNKVRLNELLATIDGKPNVVCHAVISPILKRAITTGCRKARVRSYDLTGGLLGFLETASGVAPSHDLKALHPIDQAYRQRIGAMEFTLNHDDGLGTETLAEADIVLAGISRTGKTPTSILLAQQGYRTANVSLAIGVEVPASLLALPRNKVVGLSISPSQLALIRARRQAAWRMNQTSYDHPENVAAEVQWSRTLFQRQGWATLDVTDQAVEETAARIIALVGPSQGTASNSCDLPE